MSLKVSAAFLWPLEASVLRPHPALQPPLLLSISPSCCLTILPRGPWSTVLLQHQRALTFPTALLTCLCQVFSRGQQDSLQLTLHIRIARYHSQPASGPCNQPRGKMITPTLEVRAVRQRDLTLVRQRDLPKATEQKKAGHMPDPFCHELAPLTASQPKGPRHALAMCLILSRTTDPDPALGGLPGNPQ